MNVQGGTGKRIRLSLNAELSLDMMFGEPRQRIADLFLIMKNDRETLLLQPDVAIPDSAPQEIKNALVDDLGKSYIMALVMNNEEQSGIAVRWFEDHCGCALIFEIQYPVKFEVTD